MTKSAISGVGSTILSQAERMNVCEQQYNLELHEGSF